MENKMKAGDMLKAVRKYSCFNTYVPSGMDQDALLRYHDNRALESLPLSWSEFNERAARRFRRKPVKYARPLPFEMKG